MVVLLIKGWWLLTPRGAYLRPCLGIEIHVLAQLPLWQRRWRHRDLIRAHPNAFPLSQAMITSYPSSAPMLGRSL